MRLDVKSTMGTSGHQLEDCIIRKSRTGRTQLPGGSRDRFWVFERIGHEARR